MSENAESLPKNDPRRDAVARRLRKLRTEERGPRDPYKRNRDGRDYLSELKGIQLLFNYVRKLPSNRVLDIGAGSTLGVHELSQSPFATGLEFEATSIRILPEAEQRISVDRIHITPVETLRGIDDSSIGCAIAVLSIGYSADPELAIKSIDRVLVPGGVLKASFPIGWTPQGDRLKKSTEFRVALQNLNYDIAPKDDPAFVILAIKPGGSLSVSAETLLRVDEESEGLQVQFLMDSIRNRN